MAEITLRNLIFAFFFFPLRLTFTISCCPQMVLFPSETAAVNPVSGENGFSFCEAANTINKHIFTSYLSFH